MKRAAPKEPSPGVITGAFLMLKAKLPAVFIAALSFAMLSAVASAFLNHRIESIEEKLSSEFSLTREEFRAEAERQILILGSLSMEELSALLEEEENPFSAAPAPIKQNRIGITYIMTVLPIVLLTLLTDLAVAFVSVLFFLLLFTRPSKSAYEISSLLPRYILSSVGLFLWMLLRSLVSIPVVGPFVALYMLPRLSFAPVILLSGEAGIFPSLRLSLKRTKRQWLTVTFHLMGLLIVSMIVLWTAFAFIGVLSLFSLKLAFLLWLITLSLVVAFLCAGLVMLSASM